MSTDPTTSYGTKIVLFLSSVLLVCAVIIAFKVHEIGKQAEYYQEIIVTNFTENQTYLDLLNREIFDLKQQVGSFQKDLILVKDEVSDLHRNAKETLSLLIDTKADVKAAGKQFKDLEAQIELLAERTTRINTRLTSSPAIRIVPRSHNYHLEKIFNGIGIKVKRKNDAFVIVETLGGRPAEKAGLYSGDQIIAINGQEAQEMSNDDFFRQIRGEVGTSVNISYKPAGSVDIVKKITIIREEIDLR